MNKLFLIIIVVVILFVGVYYYIQPKHDMKIWSVYAGMKHRKLSV